MRSTQQEARRARIGVSSTFLLHAAVSGTWAPRVPALKEQSDLSDGELGLALVGMAAGLLIGTRMAGGPVDRLGARPILRVGVPLLCAALLLPALARSLPALAAGFFVQGFLSGLLDVAMNAEGVEVERRLGRPILNGLHGLWSVGLGAGALLAALAAAADLTPTAHFALAGAAFAAISVPALRDLLPATAEHERDEEDDAAVGLWSLPVLLLGGISFCSFVGEGTAADWSAVYLREDLGTSAAVAAAGFFAFSVAMALSRFAGDRLHERLGPVALARGSSLLASVGLAAGLAINEPPAVIVGFALVGAGLGPVVPLAFSAAGHRGGTASARVLGRVVTFGYVGSVLGPLAIGGLSELAGLRVALFVPAALALLIAIVSSQLAAASER
jgi:MFS family permease